MPREDSATLVLEDVAPRAKKTREFQLREFGMVMALACTVVTGILLWKESSTSLHVSAAALAFLTLAIFAPFLLSPLERIWMRFAHVLNLIMTRVVVSLLFFIGLTPMALLMRMVGRRPLKLKIDRDAPSYWEAVELDGPATRPLKPY